MVNEQEETYIAPIDAARQLNVSRQRISTLTRSGKLQCKKMGRVAFPSQKSVSEYKDNPLRILHRKK